MSVIEQKKAQHPRKHGYINVIKFLLIFLPMLFVLVSLTAWTQGQVISNSDFGKAKINLVVDLPIGQIGSSQLLNDNFSERVSIDQPNYRRGFPLAYEEPTVRCCYGGINFILLIADVFFYAVVTGGITYMVLQLFSRRNVNLLGYIIFPIVVAAQIVLLSMAHPLFSSYSGGAFIFSLVTFLSLLIVPTVIVVLIFGKKGFIQN